MIWVLIHSFEIISEIFMGEMRWCLKFALKSIIESWEGDHTKYEMYICIWSSELNSPIPVHFSSLIPRMSTFTLHSAPSDLHSPQHLPMDTHTFLCLTPHWQYSRGIFVWVLLPLQLLLHADFSFFIFPPTNYSVSDNGLTNVHI